MDDQSDPDSRGSKTLLKKSSRVFTVVAVLAVLAVVIVTWWNSGTGGGWIQHNLNAVATVIVYGPDGNVKGQGSGFFINSTGLFVTNAHVMHGAASAVAKLPSGAFYAMKEVKAISRARDLAILQFDGKGTPYVTGLGNSDDIRAGDKVYAIGTPNGLEASVSEGNVSNPDRQFDGMRLIQFTAPISPGSSGGGLFNEGGRVIGITSGSFVISSGPQAGLAQNLNYAVPISYLKNLIADTNRTAEGNATYYYLQGLLADNQKNWNKAADLYSKAIELDSTYGDAYMGLAGVYYSLGDYQLELKNYLAATAVDPNNSDAYYYLATAYEDVAQYDKAFDAFKKAIALAPDDKDISHDFAILCLATGNKKAAKLLIKNLSGLDPGWGAVLQSILDHQK